jgi:hypothetical protein
MKQNYSVSRVQANQSIKAEMYSFEGAIKALKAFYGNPEVNKFLKERGVSIDWLRKKAEDGSLACKAELYQFVKVHTFTSESGVEYQEICRTSKGEVVQAKWSIAKVLEAIDNRAKGKKPNEEKAPKAEKSTSVIKPSEECKPNTIKGKERVELTEEEAIAAIQKYMEKTGKTDLTEEQVKSILLSAKIAKLTRRAA